MVTINPHAPKTEGLHVLQRYEIQIQLGQTDAFIDKLERNGYRGSSPRKRPHGFGV